MTYNKYYLAQLRLAILRVLSELPAYGCNSSTLKDGLKAWAFDVPSATFSAELQWLADSGLITLEDNQIKPTIKMLKLTERGLDVASGLTKAEGVAKPSP